jgi:hypothetical protein
MKISTLRFATGRTLARSISLFTLALVSLSAVAKESAWTASSGELCFRLTNAADLNYSGTRPQMLSIPEDICLERVGIELNVRKGIGEVVIKGSSEVAGGHAYKTYGVFNNREAGVLHSEILSRQEGSICSRNEDVRLSLTLDLDGNNEIVGRPKLSGTYSVNTDDCHTNADDYELKYRSYIRE